MNGCFFRGLETGQVLGRVNLVSGHVKTQLIAHDKEVYDIAFSKAGGGRDMFASVGADGELDFKRSSFLLFGEFQNRLTTHKTSSVGSPVFFSLLT